jgi:hypothetical protein
MRRQVEVAVLAAGGSPVDQPGMKPLRGDPLHQRRLRRMIEDIGRIYQRGDEYDGTTFAAVIA